MLEFIIFWILEFFMVLELVPWKNKFFKVYFFKELEFQKSDRFLRISKTVIDC